MTSIHVSVQGTSRRKALHSYNTELEMAKTELQELVKQLAQEARFSAPTASAPATPAAKPLTVQLTIHGGVVNVDICPDCGALMISSSNTHANETVTRHREWHDVMAEAIREQVEEELDSRRNEMRQMIMEMEQSKPARDKQFRLDKCANGFHVWREKSSVGYGDYSEGMKVCDVCGEVHKWTTSKANTRTTVERHGLYKCPSGGKHDYVQVKDGRITCSQCGVELG